MRVWLLSSAGNRAREWVAVGVFSSRANAQQVAAKLAGQETLVWELLDDDHALAFVAGAPLGGVPGRTERKDRFYVEPFEVDELQDRRRDPVSA